MSPDRLIIDTNVLLDLFVFEDQRVALLHQDINSSRARIFFCTEMLIEFSDVLARPLFGLSQEKQGSILMRWQEMGTLISLEQTAAIRCSDPDDQIFIDLAYQLRPAILYSKDLALIDLRNELLSLGIELKTY